MATPKKKSAESFVKDIRNNIRRIFTVEQKILIVMEGLTNCQWNSIPV